jgi:hypothetical protein
VSADVANASVALVALAVLAVVCAWINPKSARGFSGTVARTLTYVGILVATSSAILVAVQLMWVVTRA